MAVSYTFVQTSEGIMIFHRSNLGSFGSGFRADLGGYVATSAADVRRLDWPHARPTWQLAREWAAENRRELRQAEASLQQWQNQ